MERYCMLTDIVLQVAFHLHLGGSWYPPFLFLFLLSPQACVCFQAMGVQWEPFPTPKGISLEHNPARHYCYALPTNEDCQSWCVLYISKSTFRLV